MPVNVEAITFTNEQRGETTDYLIGEIGDKIEVNMTVAAEWTAEAGATAEDLDFVFSLSGQTITAGTAALSFIGLGFNNGDTITVSGTSSNDGNYTITNVTADVITVVSGLMDETSQSALITGTTECTGVNFWYNLIENSSSATYASLVDGNEMKFSLGGLDYTLFSQLNVPQTGVYKSNHLGTVTITGGEMGGTLNTFYIKHTFYITPLFLLAQAVDIENLDPPSYYVNNTCLRYIFKCDLLYNLNNPNKKHSTDTTAWQLGNTGWFNENFNGNLSEYSINTPNFSDSSGTITYINYAEETDFSIDLTSDESAFSNSNTKFVINHFILPEEESEYIDTTTDFTTNFMFDRKLLTAGASALNGDNYGTDKQVLKTLTATVNSSSSATIDGKIDLSTEYAARLSDEPRKVVLFVTVQDHSLTTENSDKVALLPGVYEYDSDLSNDSVGGVTLGFQFMNETVVSDGGSSTAGVFVEDGVLSIASIYVDTSNDAIINTVRVKLYATHATYGDFTLEQREFDMANAVVVGGIQQVNVNETRGFQLKSGNVFNQVTLVRDSASDDGDDKYYTLKYGFKIRWGYFKQLLGVNSQFYDTSEDFNGYNHDWNRYWVASGWSLKVAVEADIEENNYVNTISTNQTLNAYNYNDASDWDDDEIICYDHDTSTAIGNFILGDAVTKIEALFTYNAGTVDDIDDFEGIIELERYEIDGSQSIDSIHTLWEVKPNKRLYSILSTSKCKKEIVGSNQIKLTCLVDYTKLDQSTTQYKISARVYGTGTPVGP